MILDASSVFIVAVSCLLQTVQAATPAEWRNRSIYQIFTDRFARTDGSTTAVCAPGFAGYCGGTWEGIISKLDYIQGMGFTAIWISPIVQQVSDATRGYHGYSAVNIYNVNSHFGSATDLTKLSQAVHARNMYLMVDVVPNHMAYDGTAETVDYTTFSPFNNKGYFHSICWIPDYDTQKVVEQCWLGDDSNPLPDVNTTLPTVRNMYSSWVKQLVANYSIDGLRVDSVKNVEKDFWPIFNSASGIYNVGEVSDGRWNYACPYQNYMDGVLDYPSYYQATQFFSKTSSTTVSFISEFNSVASGCKDTTLLGSFSENHDQPRFASYTSDIILAKNIVTYTMLGNGIPIVYQGQEQHFSGAADPYDREAVWLSGYNTTTPLYQLVKELNTIRSAAFAGSSSYSTSASQIVYSDAHTIAFRRGTASSMTLTVVNNRGSASKAWSLLMPAVGFPAGLKVVELLSCTITVVNSAGALQTQSSGGLPLIYLPYSLLSGSGLCTAEVPSASVKPSSTSGSNYGSTSTPPSKTPAAAKKSASASKRFQPSMTSLVLLILATYLASASSGILLLA